MPASDNRLSTKPKTKIAKTSWLLLIIGLLALLAAFYMVQNQVEDEPIETITREGVVTQIQQLNRLQTVGFSVDTVITSQREGSWQKLWTDEQKGLFIVRGRVEAGVDLANLTPDMVRVTQPSAEDIAAFESATEDDANLGSNPAVLMPKIDITLPQSEIFSVYLDDIEIYDWQAGVFGMTQVDPRIFEQAQKMGKTEVLEKACRGDVMTIALDNAQSQLQQLFALTGATVTVTTQGAGACRLPASTA
ncbi:DUF4230 domain-containing protein [Psychrobacter sp. DM8]|uniref:DUF4230 domain-containing protein n=2 Tax=unclassified Psychrobacter TaxID=196806 RepID=UPI003F50C2E1